MVHKAAPVENVAHPNTVRIEVQPGNSRQVSSEPFRQLFSIHAISLHTCLPEFSGAAAHCGLRRHRFRPWRSYYLTIREKFEAKGPRCYTPTAVILFLAVATLWQQVPITIFAEAHE